MNIKVNAAKTEMRSRPLIFLDLETTGLEVQKHEIIEIGALKVSQQKPFDITEEFAIKIKPLNLENADKDALKIVGFSEKEWQNATILGKGLDALDKFAENGVLVGFNVTADWAFLDKAYFSLDRQDPFYYHRLDVLSMAYLKLYEEGQIKRFSLGKICKYYAIQRDVKHRALDDARATYLVFKKLFG